MDPNIDYIYLIPIIINHILPNDNVLLNFHEFITLFDFDKLNTHIHTYIKFNLFNDKKHINKNDIINYFKKLY